MAEGYFFKDWNTTRILDSSPKIKLTGVAEKQIDVVEYHISYFMRRMFE